MKFYFGFIEVIKRIASGKNPGLQTQTYVYHLFLKMNPRYSNKLLVDDLFNCGLYDTAKSNMVDDSYS